MENSRNQSYIPVAFLPYRQGHHYILRDSKDEEKFYYALYPDHTPQEINRLEAERAVIEKAYMGIEYSGAPIPQEQLSEVLRKLDPESIAL